MYQTVFFAISQTLVKLFAGFIIIKLVAILGGTEGIAKFGAYQNFYTILLTLSGGIVLTGVTSTIANADSQSIQLTYTDGYKYTQRLGFLSTFVVLPICLFCQKFLMDYQYPQDFLVLLLSVPFIYLQSRFAFYIATLNGLNKINVLAKRNVQASLLVIFFSILSFYLIPNWQFIAIMLCASPSVLYLYIKFSKVDDNLMPTLLIGKKLNSDKLNKFALAGLASAICMPIAQLYIRTDISELYSESSAGIWQGIIRLSEVYLVFISSVLSIYLIPKMASVKNRVDIKKIIYPITLFTIISSMFSIVFIYIFRDAFIQILFDKSFISMNALFIYQLPGDFIKIISWVFSLSLLAQGQTKTIMSLEIIFTLVYVLLSTFLLPLYGIQGAIIGYTLNYILYFIVVFLFFIRRYKQYE